MTTLTSPWLLSSLGVPPSCVWLDRARGLLYRPVRGVIPSSETSLTYLLLTFGRSSASLVDSMVRRLFLTITRSAHWPECYADFMRVGDVVYLNVLGQEMIILNSSKAAVDLLDKKSATYSDRPVVMMCGEIIGWNKSLALTQYGPRFREFRKYMSKLFGTRASVEKFEPLQEKEIGKFLVRVLNDPGSLVQHIRK